MISSHAVFSLGVGKRYIPYFLEMKKLGFKIIACDKNPNAEGRKIVDYFKNISTYDLNGCLSVAAYFKKKVGELKIVALTAGLPVYYSAIIRKRINKEKIDLELYKSFVDKNLLRRKLTSVNFSKLRSVKTNNTQEARKFLKKVSTCVIKPNFGSMSSNWTLKVSDEKMLDIYFKKICKTSLDKNAYLEEFCDGEEYKVSTIWSGGEFKFFSPEKAVYDEKVPVVSGHAIGNLKNYVIFKKLKTSLVYLFKKLEMPEGPVGLDVIVFNNSFEILDFELVLSDTHIISPFSSKYNVYENEIAAIFNKKVQSLKSFTSACCLRRIFLPANIKGRFEKNKAQFLMSKYIFLKNITFDNAEEIISGPYGRYKNRGFFITSGRTQEETLERSGLVYRQFTKMFL